MSVRDIGWGSHNREVSRDSALKGLEDFYVPKDRRRVAAFVEENRLRAFLQRARNPLNAAFGVEAVKTLTLVSDDEGFETLYCLILVPGEMREAKLALRAFDEQWWLARSHQVAGKLNFDFELT